MKRCFTLAVSDPKDRILTLTAHAGRVGDIKSQSPAVQQAREMGRRLVEMVGS